MEKFLGSGDSETTAAVLLELLLSPHTVESSTKGKGWPSRSHCTTAPSVALTTQVSVAFSPNRSVTLDGNSRNTACSGEQRVLLMKTQAFSIPPVFNYLYHMQKHGENALGVLSVT